MFDDYSVADSSNLLAASSNPTFIDSSGSTELSDLITPKAALNRFPDVGINNSFISLDMSGVPQNTEVLTFNPDNYELSLSTTAAIDISQQFEEGLRSTDAPISPIVGHFTNDYLTGGITDLASTAAVPIEIPANHWNARIINRDASNVADYNSYDFTDPAAIIDLGSQDGGDGSIRLFQDFGLGSPANGVQSDNFAMLAWTRTRLEAGKLYKVTTKSDDGTWFMLKNNRTGEWTSLADGSDGGDWRDRSTNESAKTIYFKVLESDDYDFHAEYYERTGHSVINVSLEEAKPFHDFVDGQESSQWKSSVFWWDGKQGNMPPIDFHKEENKLGVINLGSNDRSDGKKGISHDWGEGILNGDFRLTNNFFAIRSYTHAYFEAGKTYKASVRADDGYQLLAKSHNTGEWVYFTPENEWKQDAYGAHKEIEFQVPHTGGYDFHFHHYEAGGNAYFDLSWQVLGSGYLNELASWSHEQWNWAAGDNTRITGSLWRNETNETGYQGHQAILQTYNDLATAILGNTYRSTAGYVQDPSYRNDPGAGRRYGWHSGIDIDTPNGTPTDVKALVGGTVRIVDSAKGNQFLEIAGDDGRFYWYGHLSSVNITSGKVSAGDVIGQLGMSQPSNHLHFQVNKTKYKPSGYNPFDQSDVYEWTLNPLKVFWQLKQEGQV